MAIALDTAATLGDIAPIHGKSEGALPVFSVIMANFNNARYLCESIESVLAQTARNWELIICDDASTDNSVQLVRPYLVDSRIRLLSNPVNMGYVATLNRLVRESSGELIGTLDSDDALFLDAVERSILAHSANPHAPFVYSQFVFCDENLRTTNVGFCRPLPPGSTFLREDCVSHFRTWKRWASERVGEFSPDIIYAEDKDFICRMEEVGPLVYVNEALYRHRVLRESQSHGSKALISRASHQLAVIRAWERRRDGSITSISRWEAVNRAWYGFGLALRKRSALQVKLFSAWLLRHPGIGRGHMRRFVDGLRGRN